MLTGAGKYSVIGLVLISWVVGCRQPQLRSPGQCVLPAQVDYADYQTVLNTFIRNGRVRYEKLKTDSSELDRFLASLAFVGPRATYYLFKDQNSETTFWINVYNAAAIQAAVRNYPVESVKSTWLSFEQRVRIVVDGRELSLAQIAHLARSAGQDDPRIDLALVLPAMGSPKLSAEVYRPDQLDDQLARAVRRAMDNPRMVKIDHAAKTLLLGRALYQHRDRYIAWYEKKYNTEGASIVNALASFANDTQRRRLNTTVGYSVSEIPFDWSLNIFDEPACNMDRR